MSAVDINPIPRFPVFTPRQAIAYARAEVDHPDKDYTGMCLHSCAWFYGFSSSGVYDASSFWRGMPASQKRAGDHEAPAGSIALWTGGSSGHGHASLVVGRNRDGESMIASTDIRRAGKVDVVPLGEISRRWGLTYAGWAKPYFQFGTPDDRRAPDVYGSPLEWGDVYVSALREGAKKSDSVRKLQHRLGVRATGNWNVTTHDAVERWQERNGFPTGEGHGLSNEQANRLFGWNYFVRPKA